MRHQQQPTWNSCTSTCLAMILDQQVERVIEEFHDKYCAWELFPDEYLESKGLKVKLGKPWDQIRECGMYLLCVPSLGIEGGLHSILYWISPADNGEFFHQVLDPNQGLGAAKYYISSLQEVDDPLAVKLKSYSIDLTVLGFVDPDY